MAAESSPLTNFNIIPHENVEKKSKIWQINRKSKSKVLSEIYFWKQQQQDINIRKYKKLHHMGDKKVNYGYNRKETTNLDNLQRTNNDDTPERAMGIVPWCKKTWTS